MNSAHLQQLPLWAELLVSLLVLTGSLLALIGSFGLVRLHGFFQRIHAPTLVTTLGLWCIVLATMTYFSVHSEKLFLPGLLIPFFIALTTPITTIFLMRAALFRARLAAQPSVPPTVSMPTTQPPQPQPPPAADAEP